MKPSETPDIATSVETLRGLWPAASVVKKDADPVAKEKDWDAAIADVTQVNRLLANAGEYGAAVATDPAKLFRDARDRAQALVNQAPATGTGLLAESAHEAVSAIKKPNASWDWSKIPKVAWEGEILRLESVASATPASVSGVRVVCASINPATSPTESSRKVKLEKCLDLTDPAAREQLNISEKTLLSEDALIWQIGREAYVAGFNGIIAPSASAPGGKNIVSFGSL